MEGERFGEMNKTASYLFNDCEKKEVALKEKQQKLFNSKDLSKWNNPEIKKLN
eukprot:CAMPEP_0176359000 /NCGR_PEP_ID=MMETSP0126-20121128/15988_1 /TAXON_ID=141414 ORGANISM="Strombidinopsis acuminatum, Strain SPMC142" /NCGR_SAMPLE_ID=MMETSP0126 /ASSEMBLY_ACC=CAM_ASM_000229 /LENGTH=52 /DNA_ID=CAMNT_0017713475 /DNA_START=1031 /DNA_END=1192 /DNA_ORIENTATION=+